MNFCHPVKNLFCIPNTRFPGNRSWVAIQRVYRKGSSVIKKKAVLRLCFRFCTESDLLRKGGAARNADFVVVHLSHIHLTMSAVFCAITNKVCSCFLSLPPYARIFLSKFNQNKMFCLYLYHRSQGNKRKKAKSATKVNL